MHRNSRVFEKYFRFKEVYEKCCSNLIFILVRNSPLLQFSQLLHIQRRLGKEVFPLIEQSYFPNHKEMVST